MSTPVTEDTEYNETEFWETFAPIEAPTGSSGPHLWEFEEVRNQPIEQIWTIVETGDDEDENWYALPGFHIVNRIGYAFTAKPWPHEGVTGVWFDDN